MNSYRVDPVLVFLVGMATGVGLLAAVLALLGELGGC